MIPFGPPLSPPSPPSDIYPIEDILAPSFDFGLATSGNQPCFNCPLYSTCAKDAPQRLICATSSSPPQSPLTIERDEDFQPTTSFNPSPISLAIHPEFSFQSSPTTKHIQLDGPSFSPQSNSSTQPSPQQLTQQTTPQQIATPTQQLIPQTTSSISQQVITIPSTTVTVQQRNFGCCSVPTSSNLPPLLDDTCNCQSLVQREMAKITASLETISALMQLQNGPLVPTVTIKIPDTTIEVRHPALLPQKHPRNTEHLVNLISQDCNDEFAKALGYEDREDLLSTSTIDVITAATQQMMKPQQDNGHEESPMPSKPKLSLTALIPDKWAPGLLKYISSAALHLFSSLLSSPPYILPLKREACILRA